MSNGQSICEQCGKPRNSERDEFCHIIYDAPKTYEEYVLESETTHQSIIDKYGAPKKAKPPGTKYSDYEYRRMFFREKTKA